jgi:mycothiol synthase
VPAPTVTAVASRDFSTIASRVHAIDNAVAATDGHVALGDAVWRDLEQPRADSIGLLVADQAYAHVARGDNVAPRQWAIGLAITAPARDASTLAALVDAAAEHVARRGGGRMVAWAFDVQADDDARMAHAGLQPARDLYEMRVGLPLSEAPVWPPGITVRDFEPGRDESAWLKVNNRAFARHPEQGAWTEATLALRIQESWFDPTIFVLAFDDTGLAGFNWCKIHPATETDPALGEIWVIGVDPRLAGHGLGRPLAIEGLSRMQARGLSTGSLFTDADNAPAVKLYRSLGFTVHRTDRSYAREVPPA